MQSRKDKVTVIFPLYNPEIYFLTESLREIIKNENSLIDKIILVDDGSKDPVLNHTEKFKVISPKIEIVRQENGGAGSARNTGVALAHTKIVVFTDHDCRPTKDWIKNLISPILHDNAVSVGGTVLTYEIDNIISKFADFRELLRRPVRDKSDKITNIITANSACLVDVFNEAGGFDPSFRRTGEDLDFTYKLCQLGYQDRLSYAPESVVLHKHRSNLGGFWKQQSNYGFECMHHCLYRHRDPKEINFIFPTPFNTLIYAFKYFYLSLALIATVDNKKYGDLNKCIIFPALEYIRKLAILTGGIKFYYTWNPRIETSLVMIKPDAVMDNKTDEIKNFLISGGATILQERDVWLTRDKLKSFYQIPIAKEAFDKIVKLYKKSFATVVVFEAENAVALGYEAKCFFRRKYNYGYCGSTIHAADSVSEYRREADFLLNN